MNAKSLLLGAALGIFATSTFASDALLSPRAKDNQPRLASAVQAPVITVSYVDTSKVSSQRAQAAQPKVVKGVASDVNPASECRRTMPGSPRAVTACIQSTTMPGCMKLADAK